jgi:NitT/TauT family transport system substrate-binding protein
MKPITRRASLAGVASVAAMSILPRSSRAAEPFKLVVTTTETPVIPNSVMELSALLGYYQRAGVNVEIVRVQQTPSAVAALASGQGHMANISVDTALQLVSRKQLALKSVLSPNKSLPYLIAAKSSINDPKELAGKAFGIGRVGSLDHSLSMLVLRKHGADENAIKLVSIGQPNVRAQALAVGRIDATTMSIGVWLSIADRSQLKVLITEPDYYAAAPVLNKVNVVTDQVLKERPADVAAVTKAIVLASRDFAREPKLWVEAMLKERPDVPRADLEQLATAFKNSWSVNGGLNRAEIEYTTDWTFQTEDFKDLRRPALSEWVDFSVLQSVLKEVGVAPNGDPPLHS